MKNSSVTQATAWRVRCYDTKGRLHSDWTIYEPMQADILANIKHHYRVEIDEYALVGAASNVCSRSAETASFIATQADSAGEV